MPKDTAGSAVWTIGKLVGAAQEDPVVGVRIEIPRFQRHLVWSNDQRKDLIDSIHRGYPIGSILLFKRPNPSGSAEMYQVVDGLQRTSTLLGYMSEPLVFAPADLFPEPSIRAIALAAGVEPAATRRAIEKWMREVRALNFKAGFSPEKLTSFLLTELSVSSGANREDLLEAASEGLDGLKAAVDIGSVSIPVVTYSGPEGELPEIFERINQSGTKLNKYEVFAATWLNTETQVSSEAIRVAINEKYNALISRGFTISGLEADRAIQDFNLFEYLFGFGKTLVKDQTLLFSARSDPGGFKEVTQHPGSRGVDDWSSEVPEAVGAVVLGADPCGFRRGGRVQGGWGLTALGS